MTRKKSVASPSPPQHARPERGGRWYRLPDGRLVDEETFRREAEQKEADR